MTVMDEAAHDDGREAADIRERQIELRRDEREPEAQAENGRES
jgi:hypothetical protein